nr:ubiquinol-cytochrome-c reductase complex assembly factor 1 isoform X3 [Peromyscus maniculatus bairdii]
MPQVPLLPGLASDDLPSWLSRTGLVGSHTPRALWKLSGHRRSCSPSPVVSWGWSHEKERLSKGYRRRNQISISQWVPICSQLVSVSPTQRQWGRTLSSISQRPQMEQSRIWVGSEHSVGMDTQQSRKYHTTSKLPAARDFPQPVEEKVGPFTKIIEAMGFTGPLRYSKWKIKIAALRMYTSCVEKTDFEEFFLRCQMPDTFNSWFLITLLHVWSVLTVAAEKMLLLKIPLLGFGEAALPHFRIPAIHCESSGACTRTRSSLDVPFI